MAWYDKKNDKKNYKKTGDSKVDREIENARFLGEVAKGTIPDRVFKGIPSKSITGEFKKHYQYDRFDEVWVELYEKGAILHKAGSPDYEWYEKRNVNKCFDKARVLGDRSKGLNRMF